MPPRSDSPRQENEFLVEDPASRRIPNVLSSMVIPRDGAAYLYKRIGNPAATGRPTFHSRLGWSLSLAQSNFSS